MSGITRRGFVALGSALAAAGPLGGASGQTAGRAQAPMRAVATTAMLGDAARAIGGERVRVEALLGEGVDPHLYKPTRADIAKLLGADLIVANGLHLEAQFDDTFGQLRRTKTILLAGDHLPKERLLGDERYPDRHDPHVWMDASLWAAVAGIVRDALAARDPAGRPVFDANLAGYTEALARLHDYARGALASVPADRRVLLTAHDAFNYFGRAYGIEVVGIQGVSTESEAGLRKIEEVVELAVTRKLPAVFVESSVSDRNVRAVVEGAARRGHTLSVGAELFSDAMGKPGSYEGTLIGMLDHNVTGVTRALGGTAPERGLNGRLGTGGRT